ncbi:MAG: phosphodiester glycosidase family protein [Candidatus Daviesbacteria bacterium]|nr:phosphodiester glycosidase family protein [Candidatus Daviesbacteria bacterium]
MSAFFYKFKQVFTKKLLFGLLIIMIVITTTIAGFYYKNGQDLTAVNLILQKKFLDSDQQLSTLKNTDQVKVNKDLTDEIKRINTNYKESISSYEKITDLKVQKVDTSKLDPVYAKVVKYLADKNYSSASALITDLNSQIEKATPKVTVSSQPSAANAPQSNTPPGSGYLRQVVNVDGQNYTVDIIAADLNSTKVIVDTASDSDCGNNCPVLPLATYVSRSGAFAGINGSYFCPADYPSCSGKTNSFDTLVMNKNKYYFNSSNNVYSTIPAAIFSAGSARFVGRSMDWGRDTGVDGVIANYPLLVSGGNINFTEAPNEPKFGGKGARSFIGNKGNMVYIGYVYSASMGESAKVLHALGLTNALNMDQGGSSALWYGGYKIGPGRSVPNAILFVRR